MTPKRLLARTVDAIGHRFNLMPIRLRLALTFAGVMIVLFGVLFLVLYTRYADGLDAGISTSLKSRAADLAVIASESDARLAAHPVLPAASGGYAQIIDADGQVLAATPQLAGRSLLSPAQFARTLHGPLYVEVAGSAALQAYRVPQLTVSGPGARGAVQSEAAANVLVVGESLADRNHALASLQTLLFVGGPIALLIACLAGYLVAASALEPVERMRSRAARMFRFESNERLPVSPARDEIRALGQTLNEMLDRVEDVVGRGRAFVAGASHELRTPLTILQLELDDAVASGRSPEELHTAVDSAREEVRRLTSLTEDLLVLAQTDQARLPIHHERFDVYGAMRVIADRYGGHVIGRTVTVDTGEGLFIEADIARLDQALSNMVNNALRFSDGPVTMRARRAGNQIELHVYDEGPGFPAGFLPQAFERFSRAGASRSRQGTGLGLSIVRAIAEAHGGRAAAENRQTGGAHVWISLPASAHAVLHLPDTRPARAPSRSA
ncbi:MAG TPA: ATP-binding protein [Solirubrobacteraceae bacterium]|nr:ATP-binding protein [Solirubrobacteraceae bacterium]